MELIRGTMRYCGIPLRQRRAVRAPDARDVVWEIVAPRSDLEFLRDELLGAFGNEAGLVQPDGFIPPTVEDLGAAAVDWNPAARRWEPRWGADA